MTDPTTPREQAEERYVSAYLLAATKSVLADRERELLRLKGPCSTCGLHYAHSGPCDGGEPKAADAGLLAAPADDLRARVIDEQARRCSYGTREGDGRTCDCKYANPLRPTYEATGCPELRAAAALLATEPEPKTAPIAPADDLRARLVALEAKWRRLSTEAMDADCREWTKAAADSLLALLADPGAAS